MNLGLHITILSPKLKHHADSHTESKPGPLAAQNIYLAFNGGAPVAYSEGG